MRRSTIKNVIFSNFIYYTLINIPIYIMEENNMAKCMVEEYQNISNIQKLSIGLEMDKVIFILDSHLMNNNVYLSKLISDRSCEAYFASRKKVDHAFSLFEFLDFVDV